jgi:hypothetical protein
MSYIFPEAVELKMLLPFEVEYQCEEGISLDQKPVGILNLQL